MEGLTIVRNRWARFAGSGTMAAGLMAALCLVLLPGCPGTNAGACMDDPCDDSDNCTTDTCMLDDANSAGFTCTNVAVDCMDDGVCNPADGECVDCLDNDDCDPAGNFCDGVQACINNECVDGPDPCDESAGETCLEDTDTCGVSCTDDSDCADNGLFCDGTAVCDTATGACAESGSPCAAGEVCDESNDVCVECLVDADCAAGETCNTTSFTCEGSSSGEDCNSNGDCPDDGVFCNGVESCDTNGMTCVSSGDPCAAGQICNETSNMCDAMAGSTFTLTAETDTFVGTVNADTFNAPANTLGDNDILDGAGGPDTVNATLLGVDLTMAAETPTLVDIETANIESRASANIFEIQGQQPTLVNLSGNADFEWFDFDGSQGTTVNLNAFEEMLTLDFDDQGLDGDDDALNLVFTNVGVDSANVVLEEGDGEELEELGLTSTGGANKVNLDVDDMVIGDVTVDGGTDLTIEAESDDLTGLVVDASSLGAMFTVRSDQGGGDTLDLTDYTGLDMVEVFDGGATDPDITVQEGAGVLFTEAYDDPTITVDGADAAGQNNNSQTVYLAGDADVDLDDLTIDEVENITINSDTTDEDDPDARENSIDDLFADELDVLTITGSTDLTFGDVLGQTHAVEDVLAGGFTGDLTVSFDGQGDGVAMQSGSGDDVLGGSDVNDVIEGGDGDDTITGNDGDDSLAGDDGDDEFVFGATAAANGNDDLEDFTTGEDSLNLSAFATEDDIAGTLSDTSTGDQVVANNQIWVITDADGSTDTAAEIAAFFGGAGTVFDAGIASMNLVLLVRDTQAGGSTTVWYVDDGDANTTVAAGEVAQVATLVDFNGTIGDDEITD